MHKHQVLPALRVWQDNAPNTISEKLLKVVDMEVRWNQPEAAIIAELTIWVVAPYTDSAALKLSERAFGMQEVAPDWQW